MPKRTGNSPTNTSPKKSKINNSTPSSIPNSKLKKEEDDEIDPPVDIILEQLSGSSSEEGEAGSDDEHSGSKPSSPTKKQFATMEFIVEEDSGGDDDNDNENSQQGPFMSNGQESEEGTTNKLNELKRKRSTSGSSKKEIVVTHPAIACQKLKDEFFEKVNQFYEQTLADQQEEEDDEVVVDIATVKAFRLLYSRVQDEEANDRKLLIDQYFRDYLLEVVVQKPQPWNLFLELSIKLAREEIASPSVPINLLTDLVELSSLRDCEAIFQFIEQRLNIWKESLFDSCKHSVLRLCNDLLRKLSREQDTIFCGKILIFVSNYFPFSERSGLNIMSEFNSENVTIYKSSGAVEKGEEDDTDDKMEIVEEKVEKLFEGMDIQIPGLQQMIDLCQQEGKKGMQVDFNLYVKFWSLQDFFRNPVQCYNKLSWRTFATYSSDVLQAYKCFKLDDSSAAIKKRKEKGVTVSGTSSENKSGVASTSSPNTSTINVIPKFGDDTYFPKYLTNKRLLDLQMGDPNFRRYFLVQLLIVLQYLTLPVKFKLETHVLNEEQLEFVKKTEEEIYEQLEQIPPNGATFVHNIKHILKTEESWNKWKNDSCPPFKKPAPFSGHPVDSSKDDLSKNDVFNGDKDEGVDEAGTDDGIKFISKSRGRRELGDIIHDATQKKRHLLGNPELTRLWNICPDNLEACRSKERDFMPSIETYFADAMKEIDTTEPLMPPDPKKEVKPKKILGNPSFGWRGLRLLARRSPLFFQMHTGSPIHPLQHYLEYVLKKIASEMEPPVTNQQNDASNKSNVGERKNEEEDEMGNVVEEEDDEMINNTRPPNDDPNMENDERSEVDNERLRNLTEDEQVKLGKVLGADWKKLGLKLSFKKDEIDFFETEHKEAAGSWMLKIWTENEGEDASIADLLYILDGLGLKDKAEAVIKLNNIST